MNSFCEVIKDIYRLKVPFETVYTSVFLIKTPQGGLLVDSATTDFDVDSYIVPALDELGIGEDELCGIVITHNHSDHAGGLKRLTEVFPKLVAITKDTELFDEVEIYPLGGHTTDFLGVLDRRSGTLISGDGIQGAGIGRYRCMLQDKKMYRQTLDRIEEDTEIQNLLFSHAYEPWYKDCIFGRGAVIECLYECKKYIGD